MANWSKQFKQIDTINSGQEYTLNDYVTLDMVNAPLNNTQYLYDVLYTTNTGLIAKVNQNTTDITNTTNALNRLKDNSSGTSRAVITNAGSNLSMYARNSSGSVPECDFSIEPNKIEIRFYYGPDSDNNGSFTFYPNGVMTVENSNGESATSTFDRFKPKYVHNISYTNYTAGVYFTFTIISTQSASISSYNELRTLLINYFNSPYYRKTNATGYYNGSQLIYAIGKDTNNDLFINNDTSLLSILSGYDEFDDAVIPS